MKILELFLLLALTFLSQVACNPVPFSTDPPTNNSPSFLSRLRNFFRSSIPPPTDGACVPKPLLVSSIADLDHALLASSKVWSEFHKSLNQSAEVYRTSAELLRQLALQCPKSEKYCQGIMEYQDKSGEFIKEIRTIANDLGKSLSAATEISTIATKSLEAEDSACSVEGGKIHRLPQNKASSDNIYIEKAPCTQAQQLATKANETMPSEGAGERAGGYIGEAVMYMTLRVPELNEISLKQGSTLPVQVLRQFEKSVEQLQNSLTHVLANAYSVAGMGKSESLDEQPGKLANVLCGTNKKNNSGT